MARCEPCVTRAATERNLPKEVRSLPFRSSWSQLGQQRVSLLSQVNNGRFSVQRTAQLTVLASALQPLVVQLTMSPTAHLAYITEVA